VHNNLGDLWRAQVRCCLRSQMLFCHACCWSATRCFSVLVMVCSPGGDWLHIWSGNCRRIHCP
jgi:hypothetical protein